MATVLYLDEMRELYKQGLQDKEGRALLEAIKDNPDDDAPRLIYSDWLEEQGQTTRAEYIRLAVEEHRKTMSSPGSVVPNIYQKLTISHRAACREQYEQREKLYLMEILYGATWDSVFAEKCPKYAIIINSEEKQHLVQYYHQFPQHINLRFGETQHDMPKATQALSIEGPYDLMLQLFPMLFTENGMPRDLGHDTYRLLSQRRLGSPGTVAGHDVLVDYAYVHSVDATPSLDNKRNKIRIEFHRLGQTNRETFEDYVQSHWVKKTEVVIYPQRGFPQMIACHWNFFHPLNVENAQRVFSHNPIEKVLLQVMPDSVNDSNFLRTLGHADVSNNIARRRTMGWAVVRVIDESRMPRPLLQEIVALVRETALVLYWDQHIAGEPCDPSCYIPTEEEFWIVAEEAALRLGRRLGHPDSPPGFFKPEQAVVVYLRPAPVGTRTHYITSTGTSTVNPSAGLPDRTRYHIPPWNGGSSE